MKIESFIKKEKKYDIFKVHNNGTIEDLKKYFKVESIGLIRKPSEELVLKVGSKTLYFTTNDFVVVSEDGIISVMSDEDYRIAKGETIEKCTRCIFEVEKGSKSDEIRKCSVCGNPEGE